MIKRELCGATGCRAAALPLSTPPRCRRHVVSVEDWYDDFRHRLAEMSLSRAEHETEVLLALQDVRGLVHIDPVASQLYTDWYSRVEPAGERRFNIGDLAVFCLMAAASGVVGNVAYDALKAIVRSINENATQCFGTMVTPENYDELRTELHPGEGAQFEVTEEITVSIRRRYRIFVDRD